MRVLINRHVVEGPWGGGNQFVRAFKSGMLQLGCTVVENLSDSPDVILIAGLDCDSAGISAELAIGHRRKNANCKIAIRINECDARKGTKTVDLSLWRASRNCDLLIFVSAWLRDHLFERWAVLLSAHGDPSQHLAELWKRSIVIHNGVDRDVFKPAQCKSFDPAAPLRVVAHHWSDNPLKGRSVYEALDAAPEIAFTYVGRHLCKFKDPSTVVVPPTFGAELAAAIANHDVYVSGSLWDPGPNHVLEALACNLPTWVHRFGGGAVEFSGVDHTYTTSDDLISILRGTQAREPNTFVPISWDRCIALYSGAISEMQRMTP